MAHQVYDVNETLRSSRTGFLERRIQAMAEIMRGWGATTTPPHSSSMRLEIFRKSRNFEAELNAAMRKRVTERREFSMQSHRIPR